MASYTLTTPRLTLNPVTPADAPALHRLWKDPDVRRYLWDDQIIDRETVDGIVDESECSFREAGVGQWAVRIANETKLRGFCGLRTFGERADIELIYGIEPAQWGHGFAVEAASAVVTHGFKIAGLNAIFAEMDVPNEASVRVAEKLGMSYVHEYDRDGLPTLRYKITRSEWRKRTKSAG